jgi:hypothetical protein
MDQNLSQEYNITPYQTDVVAHLLTAWMSLGEVIIVDKQVNYNKELYPINYNLGIGGIGVFKIACTKNAYESLEENQINEYLDKCSHVFSNITL